MPRKPKPEPTEFIAIDVETANSNYASICQVGLIVYRDGAECESLKTYINPCESFSKRNIRIHGITPEHVQDAPTWQNYLPTLRPLLENRIIIHHSHFDRIAIGRACEQCGEDPIIATWLDTVQVARRAWPDFSEYSLGNLAEHFSIEFNHHDALEDARACAAVFLKAVEVSGIGLGKWSKKLGQQYVHTEPKRTHDDSLDISINLSELLRPEPGETTANKPSETIQSVTKIHPAFQSASTNQIQRKVSTNGEWVILILSLIFACSFLSTLTTADGPTDLAFPIGGALVSLAVAAFMVRQIRTLNRPKNH